jgi:hypothetical protein
MSEFKELSDEMVGSVSGGAGKTTMGFPFDNKGTVTFTDKSGASIQISAADWKWLLGQYAGETMRDKEAALSTVPTKDVEAILNDHNSPFK